MGLNKKTGVAIWAVFHIVLIALGLSVPWKVESDLYSVLPPSDELRNVSAAEKTLSLRTMQNFTVLLGHQDFEVARSAAVSLENAFAGDAAFAETRLYVDADAMKESRDFLYENRYVLQSPQVRESLANGDLQSLQEAALQKIYGAFSIADLSHLEADPLLLGERSFDYFTLESPLMSGKFAIRDQVLAAEDSGRTYVMWSGVLAPNTSAMAAEGHVLERLDKTLDSLQGAVPGLTVSKSGVPFHSYESSKNAQTEVAWISGVSIVLILLLLLYVFRSVMPIAATLLTIGVAAFTALTFSWFVFGSIHVFTFVFGTSVIGVSIDYAIHFFTGWKSGIVDVRRHIFKSLLLGFMTTELSYVALTFAQFPLLRQMAVFSLVGLASSFLTILLIFHAIPRSRSLLPLPTSIPGAFLKIYPDRLPRWLATLFLAALIPGLYLLNVHTDLGSLYTMSSELKSGEMLNARLNNLGISANYFIVEGASAEEVLQREELLTERLALAQKDSLLKGYLSASSLLPSAKTQMQTWENLSRLATSSTLQPYMAELGLSSDSVFLKSLSVEPAYLTPESRFPKSMESLLKMLWIGEVDGKFYSAVLPLHVTPRFNAFAVAAGMPKVYAVNKMANINATLTKLSHVSLMLVGAAYVVVFLVLVFVYGVRLAIRIIRAPVVACLFLASVFGYAGLDFNFFAIVGVILTLGIGIDYALFFKEGGRRNLVTTLAVMLSACTTVISFGSLSFSGFAPVATFGLATLLGIVCCFVLSPFSRD